MTPQPYNTSLQREGISLAASESGSLQDREEVQLSSFWGLALIIHPSILLSFWREDERFRLSPLVSEALLSLSFFHSSPALTLVILHPVTQNRKRSCDDYFTSTMIFIFVSSPHTLFLIKVCKSLNTKCHSSDTMTPFEQPLADDQWNSGRNVCFQA